MSDNAHIHLLEYLWRGGHFGYFFTIDERKEKTPSYYRKTNAIGKPPDGHHVYFGVNPTGRSVGKKASVSDVIAINCLFADFDAKDFDNSKEKALNHIKGLYPKAPDPSVTIDSGGGYHCYWLLDQPYTITNSNHREEIIRTQKAWVALIGSDKGSQDIAHVLRVPGTMNQKYDPPRPVTIIQADWDMPPYSLRYLESHLPKEQPPAIQNGNGSQPTGDKAKWAADLLQRLDPWRADDYYSWVEVGMSLSELGAAGLHLWESWSQKSPKYKAGACAKKWITFKPGTGRTLGSLYHWAKHDDPQPARTATEQRITQIEGSRGQNAPESKEQKPQRPGDDDLAARWLENAPPTAFGLGDWRRYDEGVWNVVPPDEIATEIKKVIQAAKSEGVKITRNLLGSVTEMGRLDAYIPDKTWDSNYDVLVCNNGTLYISSMTLQEHSPKNYVTFKLGFDYDPKADAETFRYVLHSTIPDAADFLQEFAGYALTIDTSQEIAVWLCGPQGSGKSTILEGFEAMLGGRVTPLGLADIENSRFGLSSLQGKTLAIASEQPAIYMKATYKLNSIISGEIITIEEKFKNAYQYRPFAKIAWAMNELPRVPDSLNGLFRRVKVIKFPKLDEKDRDPQIKEAVKNEGAGILNWALEGLQRLQKRGHFEIPECVNKSTGHFQRHNDIPANFVEECCITGPDYKTQSTPLYNAYNIWCIDTNHKPLSSTSIADEWERLGFERNRTNVGTIYHGVALKVGKNE
jgi:P4 family phage/plasmid primase-like protien